MSKNIDNDYYKCNRIYGMDDLGRIPIPKVIRELFGFRPGDQFEVFVNEDIDDQVIFKRIKRNNYREVL